MRVERTDSSFTDFAMFVDPACVGSRGTRGADSRRSREIDGARFKGNGVADGAGVIGVPRWGGDRRPRSTDCRSRSRAADTAGRGGAGAEGSQVVAGARLVAVAHDEDRHGVRVVTTGKSLRRPRSLAAVPCRYVTPVPAHVDGTGSRSSDPELLLLGWVTRRAVA